MVGIVGQNVLLTAKDAFIFLDADLGSLHTSHESDFVGKLHRIYIWKIFLFLLLQTMWMRSVQRNEANDNILGSLGNVQLHHLRHIPCVSCVLDGDRLSHYSGSDPIFGSDGKHCFRSLGLTVVAQR